MTWEKFDNSIKWLMTSSDILSLNSGTLVPWQFVYINRNLSVEDDLGETGSYKFVPINCIF